MAEYIEREKVLGTIDELQRICATEVPEDKAEIYNDVFEEVYGEITRISAADVRPERHGTWVDIGDGYVACSECGEEHGWENYRASYCDTCGAKMSWEDNDNG